LGETAVYRICGGSEGSCEQVEVKLGAKVPNEMVRLGMPETGNVAV
jgi:hypothetical protein